MEPGLLSGYHEQRKHGWPRKSRTWDGKDWIPSEEFDEKHSKDINPRTGTFYGGTQFVRGAQETISSGISTVNKQLDKVEIPKELQPGVDLLEGAIEQPVQGLLSGVVGGYQALPEDVKKNIASGGATVLNTLEKSTLGYSQQFNLHPILTETAFAVGETALTLGAAPAKRFIKEGIETVTRKNILPPPSMIPIQIGGVDNPGLFREAVQPTLDEIARTPLKHITDIKPSYWHREYGKATNLKEKISILNTPLSKSLKNKSVKGGKITASKLAQDEQLINKLIERADGIIEKYIKGDQRKLYDFASHNIFNDAEAVYGTGLVKKIQQVFLVTQGREWHHIFGNKEAGEFVLNKIAQDPVLTANLFKHMDKLQLKTGAIAENMALMKLRPHKLWHEFMQQLGTESRVKMLGTDTLQNLDARGLLAQNRKRHPYSRIDVDQRPVRMGTIDDVRTLEVLDEQPWKYTAPLDVADYGHSIAEAIVKGEADVDELFTFLTVYHERYVPWVRERLKDPKFAAELLTDLPEGPEKALLLGLYGTKKGPGLASTGTRGMKKR